MRDDDGYRYHYESSGMRLWLWLVVMPPDAADPESNANTEATESQISQPNPTCIFP
jgi:hypothetical protein